MEAAEVRIEQLLSKAENQFIADDRSSKNRDLVNPVPSTRVTALAAKATPYFSRSKHVVHIEPSSQIRDSLKQMGNIEYGTQYKPQKTSKPTKPPTAGPRWFDLPRTQLTPELKRDLQLLKMRSVLDPHHHFKKDNSSALVPEFSQVGILGKGITEDFAARTPKSGRKRTLVEEVLDGERETGKFKRKYEDIQTAKRSGKRGSYGRQMTKRYGQQTGLQQRGRLRGQR